MLKKTIKYVDYDGQEREEDFYFNLSKAEITVMQASVNGGYDKYIKNIIKAKSTPELIKIFQDLIDRSFGIKSEDGKKFVKSPAILEDFKSTEAYSELFMELATDSDKASEFINGIMPKDLVEEAQKKQAEASK